MNWLMVPTNWECIFYWYKGSMLDLLFFPCYKKNMPQMTKSCKIKINSIIENKRNSHRC